MKMIDVKVQFIDDKFKTFRASSERNLASMLPDMLRTLRGENTGSLPDDFQILVARQVTFAESESLDDLHVNAGDYVILFRPSMSHVRLMLILPKQFNHAPFEITTADALIGRSSEFSPAVDVEPFLNNPSAVSRRVAWLREDDGKWYIELHPDCQTGLFLNDTRLVHGRRYELQERAVISFGMSLERPDLMLAVSLVTK